MTETSPIASVGRDQVDARDRLRRRAGRPAHDGRAGRARRRASASSSPDTIEPLPWDGESQRRAAGAAARGSRAAYYNDDRVGRVVHRGRLAEDRRRRHDRRATATSASSTARRTSSSRAASGSARSSSRTSSWRHPKVAEAAVIGVPHPKWAERPLACVVVKPGEELTKDEVLEFLAPKVAKWWLPDDVVFIDEVPKTSRRQVLEEGPARPLRRLRAARLSRLGVTPVERSTPRNQPGACDGRLLDGETVFVLPSQGAGRARST